MTLGGRTVLSNDDDKKTRMMSVAVGLYKCLHGDSRMYRPTGMWLLGPTQRLITQSLILGFRCSLCDKTLDSNTNLQVLGNGSLVCNTCSYKCHYCQKKIENLAILTGDLAFCAECFVCRNCKKRIEDLKYARTSQGIFCMSCHEAMMIRKKRNAAAKAAAAAQAAGRSASSGSASGSVPGALAKKPALGSRESSSSSVTYNKDKSLPAVPVEDDEESSVSSLSSLSPKHPLLQRPPRPDVGARSRSARSVSSVNELASPPLIGTPNGFHDTSSGVGSLAAQSSGAGGFRSASAGSSTLVQYPAETDAKRGGYFEADIPIKLEPESSTSGSEAADGEPAATEPMASVQPTDATDHMEHIIEPPLKRSSAFVPIQLDMHSDAEPGAGSGPAKAGGLGGSPPIGTGAASKRDSDASVSASVASTGPGSTASTPRIEYDGIAGDRDNNRLGASLLDDSERRRAHRRSMFLQRSGSVRSRASARSFIDSAEDSDSSSNIVIKMDDNDPSSDLVIPTTSGSGSNTPVGRSSEDRPRTPVDGGSGTPHGRNTPATTPVAVQPGARTAIYLNSDESLADTVAAAAGSGDTPPVSLDGRLSVGSRQPRKSISLSSLKDTPGSKKASPAFAVQRKPVGTPSAEEIDGGGAPARIGQLPAQDLTALIPERSALRPSSPLPYGPSSSGQQPPQQLEEAAPIFSDEPAPMSGSATSRVAPGTPSGPTTAKGDVYSPRSGRPVTSPSAMAGSPRRNVRRRMSRDLSGLTKVTSRSPITTLGSSVSPSLQHYRKTSAEMRADMRRGGHRRSVSDHSSKSSVVAPVSPREALAAAAASIVGGLSLDGHPTIEGESAASDSVMRELVRSKKRIAELERMLAERDAAASGDNDADARGLASTVEEKRKTIADLEAKRVVVKEELRVLEGAAKDGRFDSGQLVDELSEELASVKAALVQEIQELMVQRDLLKAENENLARARDKAVEESSLLNIKNSQLADMNNELTKQIIEKFGPYAFPSGPGGTNGSHSPMSSSAPFSRKEAKRRGGGDYALPSSAMASALALASHTAMTPPAAGSDDPLSPPVGHAMEKSSSVHSTGSASGGGTGSGSGSGSVSGSAAGAQSYSAGEEPMVTVLDPVGSSTDGGKNRQIGRRFWKRPGAVVAKGLNRVFATEEVGNAEYVDLSGGVPREVSGSVTSSTGGSSNGMKQSKSSRNGWFTNTSRYDSPNPVSSPQKGGGTTTTTTSGATATGGLMGTPIINQCALEGSRVPVIVTRCIQEVEARGLLYEGLYRKSGGKSQIQSIIEAFEKAGAPQYDEALSGDIAGVTSALKQYLRYLPVPLISFDVYDDFIKAGGAKDTEKMRAIVRTLPPAHHDTLEAVVRHLARVTTHADANLMSSRNMAVVFAPTLARDETGEREIVDMHARNDGTQLLIEQVESIFA